MPPWVAFFIVRILLGPLGLDRLRRLLRTGAGLSAIPFLRLRAARSSRPIEPPCAKEVVPCGQERGAFSQPAVLRSGDPQYLQLSRRVLLDRGE